jgi:hypothetical protein
VVGARATLQRLRDAKILHGWVHAFDVAWLAVRLSASAPIAVEDRFACRIFGVGGDFSFDATLRAVPPAEASPCLIGLEPEGTIHVVPSHGDPRYARSVTGTIEGLPVTICDVSPGGVGLITEFSIRTGEVVDVCVEGVEVRAEVRYCRRQRDTGAYRVGLKLKELDRVTRARWTEVVHGVPETTTVASTRLTDREAGEASLG